MAKSKRIQNGPTTVRLDPPQRDAIRRLAALDRRSVSNLIRVLISEALAARKAA